MLIRMNGTPLEHIADTAHVVVDVVTTPVNVDISMGSCHLISADLNPINAPQHVWDGFVQASHMIINLF